MIFVSLNANSTAMQAIGVAGRHGGLVTVAQLFAPPRILIDPQNTQALALNLPPAVGPLQPEPPTDTAPLASRDLPPAQDDTLPPHPAQAAVAPSRVSHPAPDRPADAVPGVAVTPRQRPRSAEARNETAALSDPDSRTAVYDIAAHAVYLPKGERLEAHSGLGSKLDDPRYVRVRDQGPTPPNFYDLVLREQLFHGVRALRLVPAGSGNMFGRDGILAHSYMLGPSGQSNGCVSFHNYPAFLHAFLSGEVEHLSVVAHLGAEPSRAARARRDSADRYALNTQ
jgi:hypothetical protein